jgi:hypothetical protein
VLWRPMEPVEPSIAILFMWVYFMGVCRNMRMNEWLFSRQSGCG